MAKEGKRWLQARHKTHEVLEILPSCGVFLSIDYYCQLVFVLFNNYFDF